MTPADFTSEMLVNWGGEECFRQAMAIARRGGVTEAHWDDFDHVISGKIAMPGGWTMPVHFDVLDDGTVISHCTCRMSQERGMVCAHVVALGLYMMVTSMPDPPPAETDVHAAPETADGAAEGEDASVAEALTRLVPMKPRIRATLSGSRASLSIILEADYGGALWECGELGPVDEVVAVDPNDPYLHRTRSLADENAAIELVKRYHFEDIPPETVPKRYYLTEPRNVLNFLGSGLPALRRRGWIVELSDRLMAVADAMPMVVPVVTVTDAPRGAFDVSCTFDAGGHDISPAEIQQALNRGDSYVMTESGTLLIDAEAIGEMRDVFTDCSTSQGDAPRGCFRVGGIYAPYVRAAIQALDAVDLDDEGAPNWRETASARNRDVGAKLEPVPLGPLEATLRPYQKHGVYWMHFLERSGLSGLLADEMGLGKTLQTLAWLSLERFDPEARGRPALIVCPTSLVRNWEAEAAKFTPHLKRLVVTGPDRAAMFDSIPQADLVITSYALLQRDLEDAYAGRAFSVVVLDEAQHIKNRQTRNAKSAKRLQSVQKLVLTGTPVENSVADVWSIFDFLLPGYLGDYQSFRDSTELPIAIGGNDGAAAQEKLHHKLHPFILRRLKRDVAKDLPDKIVKVAYCPMTPDQQAAEAQIRAKAKAARTKFEMLAVLMRLRQAANHMELLKERSDDPSGKLETFFELLDEAMDGGHRVLVFSQFVAMLTILRRELDARGIGYCYLDGETKDRLGECRRFNSDESIPLFLISLHAGGTGLNLTGADMVVHFDPWWNPAVEAQATDRAHRIGQKKTVYVIKMIAEGSVEERMLALQQKKQLVIDATVGASDEALVSNMSFDDLRAIAGI